MPSVQEEQKSFDDYQPKKGQSFGHIRKEYFVNLSSFPRDFNNEDDALTVYNEYGAWNKV